MFGNVGQTYKAGRTLLLVGSCCSLALFGCDQKSHQNENAKGIAPASSQVGIKFSTVRTEGVGKTFDEALQNALLLAIEQVNGVRASKDVNTQSLVGDYHSQESSSEKYDVAASQSARTNLNLNGHVSGSTGTESLQESVSGSGADRAHISGNGSASDSDAGSFGANASVVNASSAVSGVVRRFQVVAKSQTDGLWHVTIVAEIPVYQASAASKRLKIAVLPFHLPSEGKAVDDFEEGLRSQVVDALSQSGKVAVLDRDYSQENQDEIAQLQSEDFNKDEAGKLGNRLGADYIIVGTVTQANATRDSVYMQAIGQRIYGATHARAQLHFRLIEAATGVVQLSGTLDSAKYASGSLDAVAKAEAADLTNRVLDSLYPLRIESIADGVFYLGRGGDGVRIGDTFRVLRQGAPILDSDTHEVLGTSETEVGRVVVTEVEPKLSKATLVSGNLAQIGEAQGLIARRTEGTPTSESAGTPTATKVGLASKLHPGASAARARGGPKEGVDF